MRKPLTLLMAVAATLAGLAFLAGPAGAAGRHTRIVVVRPVDAQGRPVAGYSVVREHVPGFRCDQPSWVAVDAAIAYCTSPSGDHLACWKSTHRTVLCLRSPWATKLERIPASGVPSGRLDSEPVPLGLRLMNGDHCWFRHGAGKVPPRVTGHPHWHSVYHCEHGDMYGTGYNIHRSRDPWRVHFVTGAGTPEQKIIDRRVAKAFFVGTAS